MDITEQPWIKTLLKKMYMSMHLYKNIIIHAGHLEKPLILQNDLALGIQIISKKRLNIVFIGIIIHFFYICL